MTIVKVNPILQYLYQIPVKLSINYKPSFVDALAALTSTQVSGWEEKTTFCIRTWITVTKALGLIKAWDARRWKMSKTRFH